MEFVTRKLHDFRDLLDFFCDKSETEVHVCFNDCFNFNFTVFETHNSNEKYYYKDYSIANEVIWDKFYFDLEKNKANDVENDNNLIIKEIHFKKNYVNLDNCREEIKKIIYNIDCNINKKNNIFGQLTSNRNENLNSNQINRGFKYNKAKYFRLNMNFNLKELEKLEKSINPIAKNPLNDSTSYNSDRQGNKDNFLEDCFNQNIFNIQKKIYVYLLDSFITFSKKLFIIHNHINFKVYFNNEKQTEHPLNNSGLDYELIYDETFDNIARLEFNDLTNFLSVYFRIEKENVFEIKGDYVSVILAFCDYKPVKKDECNNLEILFVDNKHKNILIGEEFLNFFFNFIEDNQYLKSQLAKFDIFIDDPKAFLNKINTNNPFKREITANYLESNQIDFLFLIEPKFKYLWNTSIKNPNGHNIKLLINIETAGKLEISNDDVYFELLQRDFNSALDKLVNKIRNDKGNKFLLNAEERKVLFNIESNISKISSSVMPIFILSENQQLINLMKKFFDEIKADKENQLNEKIKADLNLKKQANAHDLNEFKKYELMESLIDAENSDFKIQELLKRKIEKLLRSKLSKD